MLTTSQQKQSMLKVEFGGRSVAGAKPCNDDAFSAHLPENNSERKHKGAVACMADGASNSDHAKLASQTAVTHFINDYYSTPDSWNTQKSAGKVIASINSWLFNQSASSQSQSDSAVTTFDALVIKSQTAHIFHVGDSRVYLFRNQRLTQLTHDHISRRGGLEFLTRGLGIDHRLDVDVIKEPLQIGDIFLLATDGLHRFLTDRQIVNALNHYREQTTTITLETTAYQLVNCAINNQSDDNASCLLVEIQTLPIEQFSEAHAKLVSKVIPPVMRVGNQIDHFRIKKVLHSSPRSHVYLAEDLNADCKRVALKVPSENFSENIAYLNAFKREYWLGRKLNSDYFIKIHPQPDNTRFLYHICDYVEGITLRQWMIDNPTPSLDSVRNIAREIAAAVRALHRNSVIHRDLKPDNIMLDRDGNIKLIDLGAAYAASWDEFENPLLDDKHHNNEPAGDIDYLAPEYRLTGNANKGSDRFSLAVIVYEMLSGELPYPAMTANRAAPTRFEHWQYQNLPTIQSTNPNSKTMHPDWVNSVLKKALSANPEQRYPALSEFISELFSPCPQIRLATQQQPLIERNPLLFWKILTGVLLSVILAQWIYISFITG